MIARLESERSNSTDPRRITRALLVIPKFKTASPV